MTVRARAARLEDSGESAAVNAAARPAARTPARLVSLERVQFAGLLHWLIPILVLIVWEASARAEIVPARLLPAPSQVFAAGVQLTRTGELQHHLLISLQRVAMGLAIGGGIGLALGFLVGLSRPAEALLDGTVQMVRNVPHLALVPLAILWFGIGEAPKIFLVALGGVFPIYLNTAHGIRSVDPRLREMGRVYGLSTMQLIRQVVLPGALPGILVGVRYALGIGWLSLVVGETIAARSGIGYLAMNAREFVRTDVVLLTIVIYALLGKFADSLTRVLERRLLRWHPSYASQQR